MNRRVAVIRTGSANLASVCAALGRLGAEPSVVTTPTEITLARVVVLPGVGAFGAAMTSLTLAGLAAPLREHIGAGRPFLAICLGLQLLAEASEESPGVRGLGVIPGTVARLPDTVRVPQLGWNRVAWSDEPSRDGYAYYANSYRLSDAPDGWRSAHTDHGGRCVAAIERPAQLACQFHPELSAAWGADLLDRWWRQC